jgi:hypothetical protein
MMHFLFRRFAMVLVLATGTLVATGFDARADLRLIMIEQRGCAYCERWNRDVSEAYANSDEGARAPLERLDLRAPVPEGVTFSSRPVFTPTFILLQHGTEVGRIEGYLDAAFFWGYLGVLLDKAAPATQ